MRVGIEHQDRFTVIGEQEQFDAHLSGRLLQEANAGGARPAVGDWVGVAESGSITHLFARRTAFRRSQRGKVQVIAANIDQVLIVTSCNLEFNERRLERYLAAVWQSGAKPLVVLSKVDLCPSPEHYLERLKPIVTQVPVFPVATPSGTGIEAINSTLHQGQTIALVGSSGVGKSTLANALLGIEKFQTAAIREQDAKGRHTTTRRELALLPNDRGVLIDTPGMRELQLTADGDDGVEDAFPDILELAADCQFRDCNHSKEPGCAVRGSVAASRLKSFQELVKASDSSRADRQRAQRTVHRGSTRNRGKGR